MDFALLWIDALLSSLLWVGVIVAFAGRFKRRWIRGAFLCLVILMPLLGLGLFVASAAMMKFVAKVENNSFIYAVSLGSAFVVGMLLILLRASRHESDRVPASATWPRGLLLLAWFAVLTLGYMTLCNMDFAIRTRCALLSEKINSVYQANSPALVSDTQNAAPIYEKVFARLRDDPPSDVNNPPFGDSLTFDPNEPATIAFLSRQASTITLLRQAAALPGCRFDQDLGNPNSFLAGGLNQVRNAANVLKLHALEEIAHGHAASAIADTAAIYAISRHFGERQMLIGALVGVGIDELGDSTLEATLPAVQSPSDLAGLHMQEMRSIERMIQQALRGEEISGLAHFVDMPNQSPVIDTRQTTFTIGLAGAYFRVFVLDLDAYIKLLENMQDAAVLPYYQAREQMQNIDQRTGMFSSTLRPVLLQFILSCARVEAMDACAQTAVAMTRFRLDHGTLPSNLKDLVPAYLDAVPIDPFNGQPIRLRIKPSQWIIYSVGPENIDHGGMEINQDWKKGDIIFTLKQPPQRPASKS
jgi:hypothetical protein